MNKNMTSQYWMQMTEQFAQASTCRVKIGAIILKENYVVGMGYTGSVHGDVHCEDGGCLLVDNHSEKGSSDSGKSCIRTIHAEMNAILKCEVRGSEDNWLTCYCTYMPCLDCFKVLLQIGVRTFFYKNWYKDDQREIYILHLSAGVRIGIKIIKSL